MKKKILKCLIMATAFYPLTSSAIFDFKTCSDEIKEAFHSVQSRASFKDEMTALKKAYTEVQNETHYFPNSSVIVEAINSFPKIVMSYGARQAQPQEIRQDIQDLFDKNADKLQDDGLNVEVARSYKSLNPEEHYVLEVRVTELGTGAALIRRVEFTPAQRMQDSHLNYAANRLLKSSNKEVNNLLRDKGLPTQLPEVSPGLLSLSKLLLEEGRKIDAQIRQVILEEDLIGKKNCRKKFIQDYNLNDAHLKDSSVTDHSRESRVYNPAGLRKGHSFAPSSTGR